MSGPYVNCSFCRKREYMVFVRAISGSFSEYDLPSGWKQFEAVRMIHACPDCLVKATKQNGTFIFVVREQHIKKTPVD